MSQDNVELVKAWFAAYNRADLDAVMQVYAPDVEIKTLLTGNHRGREAIHQVFEGNREALSGYRLDPAELIPVGDHVVVVAALGGAGRVSDIALGDRIAFLVTVKDGLIVRQETFRNKREALAAAGVTE